MRPLLFLDFDGVICDSLAECFLSSWIAHYRYALQQEPVFVNLAAHQKFVSLRPFIRDGEDYLLIHQLIDNNQSVTNQADFDALLHMAGPEQMHYYKELFYKARNFLLENDFPYWCNLNHLYPHMVQPLAKYAANRNLYILSTKRPEYIIAILKYNGIEFNQAQVLYPGKRTKYTMIKEVMRTQAAQRALFVDDQIDHLLKEQVEGVTPYLAAWGYIKPEWLSREMAVLQPYEIDKIFQEIC